jgi:hypothetical protein
MEFLKSFLIGTVKCIVWGNATIWLAFTIPHIKEIILENSFTNVDRLLIICFIALLPLGIFAVLQSLFRSRKKPQALRVVEEDNDGCDCCKTSDFSIKIYNRRTQTSFLSLVAFPAAIVALFFYLAFVSDGSGSVAFGFFGFASIWILVLGRKAVCGISYKRPVFILRECCIEIYKPNSTVAYRKYEDIQSINYSSGELEVISESGTIICDQDNVTIDCGRVHRVLLEKKKNPSRSIKDIYEEELRRPYVPNRYSPVLRILYMLLLIGWIAFLSHATYELVTEGSFWMPLKRGGRVELYGLHFYLFVAGKLCFAFTFLLYVLDHYDKRDNEEIYIKLRHRSLSLGFIVLILTIPVSFYQHERDHKCENRVVGEFVSPEAGQTAYLLERYCANKDPMRDKEPTLGISVFPTGTETVFVEHFNVANYKGRRVENVYWEGEALVIEYRVTNRRRYPFNQRRNSPVPVILKELE